MSLRSRALLPLFACLALGAAASPAWGATRTFHPRVGNALGLVPPVNSQGNFNTVPAEGGVFNAVTYHGGPTMTGGVNVHVIFWSPSAFPFQGGPSGAPTYEGVIEQYFTDVAHDSTGTAAGPGCSATACNDFTVEPQYGFGTTLGGITSGQNTINFTNTSQAFSGTQTLNPADSVILDSDPYPTAGNGPGQCSSPQDTKACILDSALQSEVDKIVQHTTGTPRGLDNLWYVFLPADVDECISQNVCGTNAFGGYHSLSNVGHGLTIYALTIDPIIEAGAIAQGADPQGNPDGEIAVDIADHETNEAMTDPTGVGWIDPNAFEVGDKCEFGPQRGSPLGFAADGSPYNQVINNHQYLTQEIWSQADAGCVQASQATITDSGLPLPIVNLTQFSQVVSGNIGSATAGVPVEVSILRGAHGSTVADQSTTTDGEGEWSLTLQYAVGDDRDVIKVSYNHGNVATGVPSQPNQTILTGNGGNPFIEGGWMGWSVMDNGSAVTSDTLTLAPCFQTGVELSSVTNGSPTDFCGTASDAATSPTNKPVTPATAVTWSSLDNRAFQPPDSAFTPNDQGGLVNLTVPAGEPGSMSAQGSFLPPFIPTGFPTCTADLGAQIVRCTGLVPSARYTLNGRQATADLKGKVALAMTVHGGDIITLENGASRTLSTLHVAHLRVDITGDGSAVTGGTCQPDQYWGGPLTGPVFNALAGELGLGGPAGTGAICSGGNPAGLPSNTLAQTDDQSGGQTVTEVADVADTSPIEGENVYGTFTALAEATDGSSPIALTISRNGVPVFTNSNVDTPDGVTVSGLSPGNYTATWIVTNANGDTRTVTTRFIEQSALQGPQGPQGPPGPPGPTPEVKCKLVEHHKIECTVTFPHEHSKKGYVRLAVSRGGKLVALGHANLKHGRARLTMRELRTRTRGRWEVTVVFSQTVKTSTNTVSVSVR